MIQPQELRIGNYLYKTMFGVDLPAQVKGIDKGVVYFDEGDEEKFRDKVDMEFAKPIPLSEDWLIKFGAIKSDVSDIFGGFLLCDVRIYKDVNGNFYHLTSAPYGRVIKLPFVHKLQNFIYEYTSQELTIKES